jgi:hypothetical protein
MQTNERGDTLISPDDNIISLINEFISTLPDGYIEIVETLLAELPIEIQEKFAIEIEKKQLKDLASRAWGIYWKSHYEISKKKYLQGFDYDKVKMDQEEINKQTMLKFQLHQQEN